MENIVGGIVLFILLYIVFTCALLFRLFVKAVYESDPINMPAGSYRMSYLW